MRLNPSKCTFDVGAGKFMDFILTTCGIEAKKDKCATILEIRSPQNLKEVRWLLSRLTSLSWFILKLAKRIQPILKMKKTSIAKWDELCQAAFVDIKTILENLSAMARSVQGNKLQLYLVVFDETISATLVQKVPKLKLICFVSQVLQDVETHYYQIEKVVLVLFKTACCLRPYFQSHQVVIRTDHPITKILGKSNLGGRMVN